MARVFTHRWPKRLPELTEHRKAIREDFYQIWLDQLPKRYGLIEEFNHCYPLRKLAAGRLRTLDIGAGRGEHLAYEALGGQEYVALELRAELADRIRSMYPASRVVVGDIQTQLEFPDGYFDRVLAIHVLEHLPDLPAALREVHRLLGADGVFSVLIPCDPGLAYGIARNVSARRMFEKRYRESYDWFVECEHINSPQEILYELERWFEIEDKQFFPLRVPIVNLNLVIGLTLRRRPQAR
jgi:SAM-dependent methyltransferase